jgi:hypothetical protein
MDTPATGKGGQKAINKQGQTSGRYGTNINAKVKGSDKVREHGVNLKRS